MSRKQSAALFTASEQAVASDGSAEAHSDAAPHGAVTRSKSSLWPSNVGKCELEPAMAAHLPFIPACPVNFAVARGVALFNAVSTLATLVPDTLRVAVESA